MGQLSQSVVHGVADEPAIPGHGRIAEAIVGHHRFRVAADLAEVRHAENDAGAFQFDDQVMACPLPVPRGAEQHEIDPAGPPVRAQDGPRRWIVAAEQPTVLDEYFVEAAVTDVQCVHLAEDPAAVLQDAER
ncbi:hypothetical protein ACH4KU_31080 [Streptomyces althioticus]|uniref:hypothetical protein n=1 Tax=Streptomyces TaxID=1883 RepID=UPI0037013F17